MRRYILTPPEKDFPGWVKVLSRYGGRIRVIYRFPTGKYYVEMNEEARAEFVEEHPAIQIERIATRDE